MWLQYESHDVDQMTHAISISCCDTNVRRRKIMSSFLDCLIVSKYTRSAFDVSWVWQIIKDNILIWASSAPEASKSKQNLPKTLSKILSLASKNSLHLCDRYLKWVSGWKTAFAMQYWLLYCTSKRCWSRYKSQRRCQTCEIYIYKRS